jgi:hypothetical protein
VQSLKVTQGSVSCGHCWNPFHHPLNDFRDNKEVNEAPRQTLKRRIDEPLLDIGDAVSIKDGVMGVVLARYSPSGEGGQNEIYYIVELRPTERDEGEA